MEYLNHPWACPALLTPNLIHLSFWLRHFPRILLSFHPIINVNQEKKHKKIERSSPNPEGPRNYIQSHFVEARNKGVGDERAHSLEDVGQLEEGGVRVEGDTELGLGDDVADDGKDDDGRVAPLEHTAVHWNYEDLKI